MNNVLLALTHCISQDMMEERAGELVLKSGDIQVWCVFDRDLEEDVAKRALCNTEFDESIRTAMRRGLKVAWSNDSFEFWVLLHFEDADPADDHFRYRQTYYERLTAIFNAMPSPDEELKKCLGYTGFNYKNTLKTETNFRNIVRPIILPNTTVALERARRLAAFHATAGNPYHQSAPCTMMHLLVEELIRVGGKKI